MKSKNLNRLQLIKDPSFGGGRGSVQSLKDFSTGLCECKVSVVFRNIREQLLDLIETHEVIIGCIAWLTDIKILKALSTKQVRLLIQKEDFLRPDSGNRRTSLRENYEALGAAAREWFDTTTFQQLSLNDVTLGDAVRCIGNHNKDKRPAFPRMHNKFAVFGDLEGSRLLFEPKIVWTGSFNWSNNASNSFENVVIIKDLHLAEAFLQEFAQLWGLSEALDWTSPWAAPEYRIGT